MVDLALSADKNISPIPETRQMMKPTEKNNAGMLKTVAQKVPYRIPSGVTIFVNRNRTENTCPNKVSGTRRWYNVVL